MADDQERAENPSGAGLSESELVEAEAEVDLVDADLEEYEPSTPTAKRERVDPSLSDADLAEAEAESDLVDADLEES